MSRRYVPLLVALVLFTAGCTASSLSTEEPTRNATLSLSGYDRAGERLTVEQRTFWDRSSSWEDPGNRTAAVASHAVAYRNASGPDAVVVYTTPTKRYVGEDRVRSLSAPALAALATRPVDGPTLGNASGPTFRGSLLGENVTVRAVTDGRGDTTGYVAQAVRDDVIVVVVVAGGADRATVARVLDSVTLYQAAATGG